MLDTVSPDDPRLIPPDARTRAWAEQQLGSAVVREVLLHGGVDARMSRLDLADGSSVVLRVQDPDADAWPLATMVAALESLQLEATGLPLPQLLAADPDGLASGVPTLLMTLVPGTPDPTIDAVVWAAALEPVLTAFHRVPVAGALLDLPDHLARVHEELAADDPFPGVPGAAELLPALRERLPDRDLPRVLLHGDLWAGNLLWTGSALTGVIDLGDVGLGVPAADRSIVRADLAMLHGIDAVEELAPADGQDFWDARTALHTASRLRDWWPGVEAIGITLSYEDLVARLIDLARVALT